MNFIFIHCQAKDAKPQARGRKVHDGEGQYEEDDATTSEQQLNGKPSEDCLQQLDIYSHDNAVSGRRLDLWGNCWDSNAMFFSVELLVSGVKNWFKNHDIVPAFLVDSVVRTIIR